ncbi:MAG: amidase domain-containing protein [Clostridia bacterium]|nr:amidase domain-containing protein [Clostridia bacterium]
MIKQYDRNSALIYARRWAFDRNPNYYNFDTLGGDCTNFVSQCVFAGTKIMNYTPVIGWYYNSPNDRTASWTGVDYFLNFLTDNDGIGPIAVSVNPANIQIGDVIFLGNKSDDFYHTLFVSKIESGNIYVASHTRDALDKPLLDYFYNFIKFMHITGVKT